MINLTTAREAVDVMGGPITKKNSLIEERSLEHHGGHELGSHCTGEKINSGVWPVLTRYFRNIGWTFIGVFLAKDMYTQRSLFGILLNKPEIRLYLPFFDWIGTQRRFVWYQINRKIVNTIWFWIDLIRFRKDFSVRRLPPPPPALRPILCTNNVISKTVLKRLTFIFSPRLEIYLFSHERYLKNFLNYGMEYL